MGRLGRLGAKKTAAVKMWGKASRKRRSKTKGLNGVNSVEKVSKRRQKDEPRIIFSFLVFESN